jgi:hypothetical protein
VALETIRGVVEHTGFFGFVVAGRAVRWIPGSPAFPTMGDHVEIVVGDEGYAVGIRLLERGTSPGPDPDRPPPRTTPAF